MAPEFRVLELPFLPLRTAIGGDREAEAEGTHALRPGCRLQAGLVRRQRARRGGGRAGRPLPPPTPTMAEAGADLVLSRGPRSTLLDPAYPS